MASPSVDDLIPLIYHEKQEPGSALCAQHALNVILQERIFSATDLSQIAQSLDELENEFDEERGIASTNMDDTGFFSIQVLERALDVWGLSLPRWRSEAMRAYHHEPETQLAFILNLNQHWFALRRFGNLASEMSGGGSHWFNLNSFLEKPQWISDLYLGMVLHQAETEGYSIFAVVPKDPDAPLPLPKTDADRLAALCPAPSHSQIPENATSRSHASPAQQPSSAPEGFEDEDYELQAAIAASMGTGSYSPITIPPPATSSSSRGPVPAPSLPGSFPGGAYADADEDVDDDMDPDAMDEDLDPVEASRRRNVRLLERFQREQGAASRELDYDPDAQRRRRQQADEEEEELRRALAESEALARAEGHAPLDADVGEEPASAQLGAHGDPPPRRQPGHRVYDDEDEELQAALRASLENVPPGFVMPESPRVTPPTITPAPAPTPAAPAPAKGDPREDGEEEDEEADEHEPKSQEIDIEAMRRARLARFGGGGGGS